MRKKITLFFILLVVIPIVIIYTVAINIFIQNNQEALIRLYSNDMRMVSSHVESFFSDALDLSIYPLMESNLKTFLLEPASGAYYANAIRNANNIFSTMPYGFSNGIRSVTLTTMDGVSLFSGITVSITPQEIEAAKALNARPYWNDVDNPQEKLPGSIELTRLLKKPSNINELIGYVKVTISKAQIVDSINKGKIDKNTAYFITDKTGRILISTTNETKFVEMANRYAGDSTLVKNGETRFDGRYFISSSELQNAPYTLYSFVESTAMSAVQQTLVGGLSTAAVMAVIFSIILSFAFSKIITSPLEKLGENMKSISNEDFSVRSSTKGDDEIAVLASSFNHMAKRLDFLYNEVYMGQIRLNQAKLLALQMQINPHFIHNTLDTIYWMSEMKDTVHVSNMVSNLSQMLRITLSPDNNGITKLSEELLHLKSYIGIQQIRYGSKYSIEINCEQNLEECLVLKLLLQPLVENALVHGLKDYVTGNVIINIYRKENTVIYDVMNNGSPIDVEEIRHYFKNGESSDSGMKGFALRNIHERIKLKNGEACDITCFADGQFSVFRVTQKYILGEQTND